MSELNSDNVRIISYSYIDEETLMHAYKFFRKRREGPIYLFKHRRGGVYSHFLIFPLVNCEELDQLANEFADSPNGQFRGDRDIVTISELYSQADELPLPD